MRKWKDVCRGKDTFSAMWLKQSGPAKEYSEILRLNRATRALHGCLYTTETKQLQHLFVPFPTFWGLRFHVIIVERLREHPFVKHFRISRHHLSIL